MHLPKTLSMLLLTTLSTATPSTIEPRKYTACQDAEMGLDRAFLVFSTQTHGLDAQNLKELRSLTEQFYTETQTIKELCSRIITLLDAQHRAQVEAENSADREDWFRKGRTVNG
ncbi:hypothetical protein BDV25DRAFT_138628 [Aspergillus avenaceus]|uniref:Uncharacterized protein n=1 Tax=Aspergillus avenaceus TaxID=36643 RepID=A0A5N6TZF9_ASPAV|nr:hypothetical protein BDV25DRAFT_138628 [Aspergillus avenaceus]